MTAQINKMVAISESKIGSEMVNSVDARELHLFLEVGKDFSTWIKGRISEYNFREEIDFALFPNFGENSMGRPRVEYALSLDMAKELSMVEKNDKGKEARVYFIQCEKKRKQGSIDVQMVAIKYAIEILKVSEVSKLQMMHKVFEINGVSTDILPVYVENARVTFSLTESLKKNKAAIGVQSFNRLLLASGYLEEKERPSKNKGVKKFKALTEKGLKFGTNDISPSNPREVQPHYFEDSFMDLYFELTTP